MMMCHPSLAYRSLLLLVCTDGSSLCNLLIVLYKRTYVNDVLLLVCRALPLASVNQNDEVSSWDSN